MSIFHSLKILLFNAWSTAKFKQENFLFFKKHFTATLHFLKKINLFILFVYYWLHQVSVAARGLSLVVTSGEYSSLWCVGFSLWWLLFVVEHGFQAHGLQYLWHTGSVLVARRVQSTGSAVVAHGLSCSTHAGSSQTRDQTRVPCIGRRILTTVPPGKSQTRTLYVTLQCVDFFILFLKSLLEYNCFTMVCQFLLYNKVNQLYIYIYPHISSLLRLPPSHSPYPTPLGDHKALS